MYYSNSNPKRITKKRFFKVGNIHHILQNQHYPMTRVFLLRWKSHIFATFKITGGQSLVLLENAAKLQHSFTMPPLPAPPLGPVSQMGELRPRGAVSWPSRTRLAPGLQTSSPFLSHALARPCKSWGHRFAQPTIAPLCWRGLRGGGAGGQTSWLLILRPSP